MTIAVTRNTPGRFDGFLASCMQEIAPGVYVAPTMKKSVRERVWRVMMDWSELLPEDAGVVLFWRNPDAPSQLSIRLLGEFLIPLDGDDLVVVLGRKFDDFASGAACADDNDVHLYFCETSGGC